MQYPMSTSRGSLEAQQAIIGSMLIDERSVGPVLAAIREEDFPPGLCRSIFACIKRLFADGKPIDPVVVLNALGGGDALSKDLLLLMDITPTSANVLQYCEILKEQTRISRLQSLGLQLTDVTDMEGAAGIISQINAQLVERGGIREVTAYEIATDFVERAQSNIIPEYIGCGIEGLDKLLMIEPGDMVGIGALPSVGKTAFSLQWAMHLAKKYRVGFFSLETRPRKLGDRMFSSRSGVSLHDIKHRIFGQDAWDKIAAAASEISELKLGFVPASGMTATDIIAFALSKRYQVIFVDYLQLIKPERRHGGDLRVQVSETSMLLHEAAQRHEILTVVLSQLSRPETIKGKVLPPTMQSFRESGQIEADLDVALLMYQEDPDNYTSNRIAKIGKNKEGQKGKCQLAFIGEKQIFQEVKTSVYAQLKSIGKQAANDGRRGEADDTGLENRAIASFKPLEGEELALPF